MDSWEFRAGGTVIKTNRIPYAYGDGLSVVATSTVDEVTSVFNITTEKSDRQNAKRIDEILKDTKKLTQSGVTHMIDGIRILF